MKQALPAPQTAARSARRPAPVPAPQRAAPVVPQQDRAHATRCSCGGTCPRCQAARQVGVLPTA